jgi:uncharacterized protein (DUF486 family)
MPSASLVSGLWPQLAPIILLACSSVFMTIAWYGHLKFKSIPLVTVVLVSWGITFVEYCFAVPANRIGSAVYSPAELKTIQEVISLIVFAGFTAVYFQGTAEPYAERRLCPDRARRSTGAGRPDRCRNDCASGWAATYRRSQIAVRCL